MTFSSIRTKLICILIFFGGLPLLVVGALSYHSAANAILVQTRKQLDNVVEKTTQQVDHFFEVAQKDIDLLADFPFVQLAFVQFEFNQRLDTSQRLLEEYFQINQQYNGIYLVNLEGKAILSVTGGPKDFLPDFSGLDWFKKTVKKNLHLGDVVSNREGHSQAVMLGKTVYDFEDPGKIIGVLAFDIKYEGFVNYITSLKIGEKGYAFLLHNRGFFIYHPNLNSEKNSNIRALGDDRLQVHLDNMMEGKRGYGDYSYENAEKFIVYLPCKLMEWSVGVTVFKSELVADIHTFRYRVIAFILVIIGLFLPVSVLFIRSLTRPISQLINGAEAIGRGKLDLQITVESNDELSAVATEFNKMAATLKTNMKEIVDLKNFREDIFRNVSSGIITVDETGKISSINKSAEIMLGYNKDSVKPHLVRPGSFEPVQEIVSLLGEAMNSGKDTRDYELKLPTGEDDVSFVEINTSKLTDQYGGLIGAIADIRDITRRKRIEELMVRVDKLASLGQLSAGMAHEIRNPLAGMKTSIQLLSEGARTETEQQLISGALFEINRLNTIVSELLSFSRPSPPLTVAVDIRKLVKKSVDLLKEKIKNSNIALTCKYDEDLYMALVDQEQLHQVILNLILNSITAMEGGGKLTIEAAHVRNGHELKERFSPEGQVFATDSSELIEVRFTDSGHGISKEDLSQVFNPFFSTSPTGTGLGLPIAHKLLEKNNGFIFIDSEIGHGTQVLLFLPVSVPIKTRSRR